MRILNSVWIIIFLGSIAFSADAPRKMGFRMALEAVERLQEEGRLAEADERVKQTLEEEDSPLTAEQKQEFQFEYERSKRIRADYTQSEKELMDSLKKSIRDFKIEEFQEWEKEGRFDFKIIDGKKCYLGASRSNLFFRYPDLRARRIDPPDTKNEKFLWDHYQDIKAEYQHASQSTLEPRHFKLRMTITVKPNEVPQGQLIRCWMPYPQQFEAQSGVKLLASTPEVSWMNAPRYPARSLYFEQPSLGEKETVFYAEYLLTTYPRYNPIDPSKIRIVNRESPNYKYYTLPRSPHAFFTPEIEGLALSIVQRENNPYLKAKRIYDWMTENIQYSYAREYSTLHNISQYTLEHKYGDCGQQALLFITLCRSQGIPARWQSGWTISPYLTNLHDWAEIYLEPYGWIPVDVNEAQFIEQIYNALTPRQKNELKEFYFGGLDAYRLIVNSEHDYPHFPPKESYRSDTVDFQRGELESGGKNLYYDQFRYRLEVDYLDEEESPKPESKEEIGPTEPGKAR